MSAYICLSGNSGDQILEVGTILLKEWVHTTLLGSSYMWNISFLWRKSTWYEGLGVRSLSAFDDLAQKVEQVTFQLEGCWFDPRLF